MEYANDKQITIDVTVDASLQKAWEIWTGPEHIVQWNFASDEWCCPSATNDVSVGSKFSWRMEAKDGSMGFDFEGTYTKVVPMELLEYTLEDGRPVRVTFEKTADGVLLTETFQGEDMNSLELQRQGWQSILNNYKRHAEQD